jgi:hypothetical protein
MIDPWLDAVYRATTYWVEPSTVPRFGLRCGERSELLDRILSEAGVRTWAFISACNPGSKRLDAAANAARMARLADAVRDSGLRSIAGVGIGDADHAMAGGWPAEPSLLVLGIDEAAAIALAKQFEQNAILAGTIGGHPTLIWVNDVDLGEQGVNHAADRSSPDPGRPRIGGFRRG